MARPKTREELLERRRAGLRAGGLIDDDEINATIRQMEKVERDKLTRAIARGSDADIAECLRLVNPKLLDPSILDALADRLKNPRGNRARAAASLHREIAKGVDAMYRVRLARGEPKRGLMKFVIAYIAMIYHVRERTVRYAISKHRHR
jgi:hypothetical protein